MNFFILFLISLVWGYNADRSMEKSEEFMLYAFRPQPNGTFQPVVFDDHLITVTTNKDTPMNVIKGNVYMDSSLKLTNPNGTYLGVVDDQLVITKHHSLSDGFTVFRNNLVYKGNDQWMLCTTKKNITKILVEGCSCNGEASDIVLNAYAKTGSIPNFPLESF